MLQSLRILSIVSVIFLTLVISTAIAQSIDSNTSTNTTINTTITNIINKAISNPKVAISMLIQFLLGLALGYYSAKIAKYLLAWIGVIIVGALLSVWSLGGSVEDILTKLGLEAKKLMPVVKDFLAALGVLTVGPVAIGFILGLVVGATHK